MRRLVPLLLVSLLLGQGLAEFLPQGARECADADCTPVSCSQACPKCNCRIDRDRLTPSLASAIPPLEPLLETPHGANFIAPQPRARDIMHVPKLPLA
jgi:hypothetical protein